MDMHPYLATAFPFRTIYVKNIKFGTVQTVLDYLLVCTLIVMIL